MVKVFVYYMPYENLYPKLHFILLVDEDIEEHL